MTDDNLMLHVKRGPKVLGKDEQELSREILSKDEHHLALEDGQKVVVYVTVIQTTTRTIIIREDKGYDN